nr:hypothetical protein BaRGS_009226 [Batillaria attramentaria]
MVACVLAIENTVSQLSERWRLYEMYVMTPCLMVGSLVISMKSDQIGRRFVFMIPMITSTIDCIILAIVIKTLFRSAISFATGYIIEYAGFFNTLMIVIACKVALFIFGFLFITETGQTEEERWLCRTSQLGWFNTVDSCKTLLTIPQILLWKRIGLYEATVATIASTFAVMYWGEVISWFVATVASSYLYQYSLDTVPTAPFYMATGFFVVSASLFA